MSGGFNGKRVTSKTIGFGKACLIAGITEPYPNDAAYVIAPNWAIPIWQACPTPASERKALVIARDRIDAREAMLAIAQAWGPDPQDEDYYARGRAMVAYLDALGDANDPVHDRGAP